MTNPAVRTLSLVQDTSATLRDWQGLILRATALPRPLYALCLTLGVYADNDGASVHPGVANLAGNLQCSPRTLQRYLRTLRALGLIQLTARGNRRRGLADTYRLTIPVDADERLGIRPRHQGSLQVGPDDADQTTPMVSPKTADQTTPMVSPDETPDYTTPMVSPDPSIRRQTEVDQTTPMGVVPPPINTSRSKSVVSVLPTETVTREENTAPPGPPAPGAPPVFMGCGTTQAKPPRRYVSGPEALAERAARFGQLVTWAQDQADAVRLGWDPVTVRTVLASATRVENGAHTPDEIAAAWTRFLSGPPAPLHQFPRKAGRWWHTHPEPATPAAGEAP